MVSRCGNCSVHLSRIIIRPVTYEAALDYIAALSHRGWRLELDRMREFVRRAGLPGALDSRRGPQYVHIAGTNGKGSVTAYVQFMLREAGYRTGGFFSPYVYDIRERVQMNGDLISKVDLARLTEQLMPISEELEGSPFGGVTEFEFKTGLAFAYWQEQRAEWVALEVGLGGRLDATNVVTPAVSVITSIGLDHTAILGDTYAQIASEKAGIFKPGVPAVMGALPPEAQAVVRGKAEDAGSVLWGLGEEFSAVTADDGISVKLPGRTIEGLPQPFPGRHQVGNVGIAVAALEMAGLRIEPETMRAGLSKVHLPGRFERRFVDGRLVVLDGAHNTESTRALVETLQGILPGRRFHLVFAMVEGHDATPIVDLLAPHVESVHLCPVGFRRTRQPEELADLFGSGARTYVDSAKAIAGALDQDGPILVTGSFYLVGEVGNWLSASGKTRAQ